MNIDNEESSKLKKKENFEQFECQEKPSVKKDQWDNELEFLCSCITLSVGLGNVWRYLPDSYSSYWSCLVEIRFPFTALENGGGTFVFAYTFIVFLVGKPLYYMELLLGQFSSRGCIKVYDICPASRGVGIGQCICTMIVLTIYASVMALTIRYFLASFNDPLPWSLCKASWNTSCVDSSLKGGNFSVGSKSSAELFFT
jgi:solute carrier family 6 (neurotransmitter transporter, glycine) member 5/9